MAERDARPTQASYDAAVATARTEGRADVTSNPASYSLVTQASYYAVVTERDERPTQAAYDAAVSTARTSGRADVTGDPASYSLVTQAIYDAALAERDERPTRATHDALETELNATITERDARPTQAAYDTAVATARTDGQDDVTAAPNNFGLTTQSAYENVADLLNWNAVFAGLPDSSATNGPAQTVIPSVQNADGFAIALKFNPAAADLDLNAKRVIYEFGGTYNGNGVYLIGGIPHFIAKMFGHSNKNPDSLNDFDWSNNAICVPLTNEALIAGSVVEIDLLFTFDAVRFSINGADPITVALDNRGELINWAGDRTLGFGKLNGMAGGLSNTVVESEFYEDKYTQLTGSFMSGGWWNQSNASGLQFGSGGLAMQESYDAALRESINPFAEQLATVEEERDAALTELNTRPTADQLAAVERERDAAITELDARPPLAAYEAAVATARTNGRADVTGDPASYSLVTQAIYDKVLGERDGRPTQASYDALQTERDAAITERDSRPTAEQLATVESERDTAITELNARPTAEQLAAAEGERDALAADIQLAYDEATSAAGIAEGDLAPVETGPSPTTFDLVWTNTEDPTDTITMEIEFPQDSITNPPSVPFGTRITGSALIIDYQGAISTHDEPMINFTYTEELDYSQELIGQAGFGTALDGSAGDFTLFEVESDEGMFNGQNWFTIRAPNQSLYRLTSMRGSQAIESRFSFLELNPLSEIYSSLVTANRAAVAERDAAIAERDSRPTAEQLVTAEGERDAAIAERDSRPTLAEVQDARVGSIVLAKDWQRGEVSLCFGLQKTDDLVSWTAFEGGTWRDAPNGEIKLTLPLAGSKKWLRLTLPE